MKIKQEELKKKGISSIQVNKITKGEMTQAFGVTKKNRCRELQKFWLRTKGPKNWEIHRPDFPKGMDQNNTATV